MVGLQTLDLAIGVRVPASQPKRSNTYGWLKSGPPVCVPLFDSSGVTMTVRLTFGLVFLACVSGFGLAAGLTHLAIVEAVNAKTTEPFGQLGWGPTKSLKLCNEYRRFYPAGKLLRRAGILAAVSLFFLLVAGTLFGLPLPGITLLGAVGALELWSVYFRKPSV